MAILYRVDDDDDLAASGRAPRAPRRAPVWLRVARLLLTLAVAGGVVFAVVTIYQGGDGSPGTTDVPLVTANLGETRVRPAQPGGMDVPHRDRVILQRGPTEDPELLATALLQAPAEEPLPEEALPTPSSADRLGRSDPTVPEVFLERLPPGTEPPLLDPPWAEVAPPELELTLVSPEPTQVAPEIEEALEADTLDDLVAAVQEAEVEPETAPTIAALIDEVANEPIAGDYRVQLAAVQDEAAVAPEWDRFVRLYPDLLDGQERLTSPAEPGRLIRVSAGPMLEADARRICGAIVERGGDCIVRAID